MNNNLTQNKQVQTNEKKHQQNEWKKTMNVQWHSKTYSILKNTIQGAAKNIYMTI